MQTRDLTTIIIMAVVQFVISALFVQIGTVITGIAGIGFLFTILLAIPISFSILLYDGRRWRIFMQLTLVILLTMPTRFGGAPFDPISRLSSLITAFLIDLLANSLYGVFKKFDKLLLWSVLISAIYWTITPFFKTVVLVIFYTPETVQRFIEVISLLLPIIIAEALVGGYIGYKIYKFRIKF